MPDQARKIRVAFDIGGVISKYPEKMLMLMGVLIAGGADVYVVTDMPRDAALAACQDNAVLKHIGVTHILCADWAKYGDRCKTVLCDKHEIDVLIDDRLDYVADGGKSGFIGLAVAPRPALPYYAPGWKNKITTDGK